MYGKDYGPDNTRCALAEASPDRPAGFRAECVSGDGPTDPDRWAAALHSAASELPLIVTPDADDPEFATVTVAGTVAGRPCRFVLDTGAARTCGGSHPRLPNPSVWPDGCSTSRPDAGGPDG